jgi:hypothetical protein
MRTVQHKPSSIIRALASCFVVLAAFGCNPGLGRINLNAELNFPDMGGLRPLAHHTVYLLSDSIVSPEMEDAFKKFMASPNLPANVENRNLTESEIRSRVGFMSSDGREIWHHYILDSVETDSQGKAAFRKVKAGEYWLYSKRPSGQWILWNVKTTVNFYDTTSVTINNAFYEGTSRPTPSRAKLH